MNLNRRERTILILAALVAVAFVLTTILPQVRARHDARAERIEDLRLNLEREQRLLDDAALWRSRRVEADARLTELQAQVFAANTLPLIEADIQRALTAHARDADMTVISTRLAQRQQSAEWMLVRQEMQFRTLSAGNVIRFLEGLESTTPRLWVTDLDIDRGRNQYDGSVTVVGFVRRDTATPPPGGR